MCAGLRGQIYAQIFQREYVPAQEHNVVVPRGAVGAHNAQSCACDALVRRLARRFQAGLWARVMSHFFPDFWRKVLNSAYFEHFCPKKLKKMSIFVHTSVARLSPLLSHFLPWNYPKSAYFLGIEHFCAKFLKKIAIFVQNQFPCEVPISPIFQGFPIENLL